MPAASPAPYIGRFAPSPTGSLHLGSLVAALGSYLDARQHGGRWLLRMEDLDTPRVVPGCADGILRTLECYGFEWDGAVIYQSRRIEAYAAALEKLREQLRTFECACSRKSLAGENDQGYPGTCRNKQLVRSPHTTTRFRVAEHEAVMIDDRFQDRTSFDVDGFGDVVIRRRDGVFAYQLAVVVDDGASNITHIVRGADLLESTAWQVSLQRALGLRQPDYAHLPVITEANGDKLAKSRRSLPLKETQASTQLVTALLLLRQSPPLELQLAAPQTILEWSSEHWNPQLFHGIRALAAPVF